ncbi:Ig-like domain repeat protein [Pseudomonas nitroreducens]|uniref:Ig-like domain repeat protein n=3 Tax=Pseudomonas nitroreducens TaxID=46680 RepID=A0A6G6IYK8_PSENT|nr:Ig-like domain repeat protein [Pseudomonas nitroreducens]QIE88149.1 Ig-like domain repeat protein [Pseudomonas nitroreducens]
MSAEKVQLVEVSENAAQRVTFKDGGKVKAKVGTKYLLKLDNNEVAPENVTVKRDGKDLLVFFQGSDKPDLVIQDFFADGMDSQLYGVSEDGQMYAYVRTDGEGFYSQLLLADGEMTPIALGGEPLGAAPVVNGEIDESTGFLLWPLLAGAGAVGGVAAATKNDDKHHTKTSPSVTDTQITDHVGPKQGVIANGDATDDPRPVISGKGEAGAVIHIYDNGQEIGSTTVGPDQTWTFTPNVDLNDGNHSIDVVQEGKGEKPSAPVHVIDFAVDTVPPSAPTAEISGAVEHDGQTYSPSNEPSIHGTGEPGDSIIVVYPTGETVTVDVKDDGTWVAPPPTQPLPEGNNDIKVIAQDPAGNQTEIVIPVIIDTIAPEAPKVWLDPDSDTGVKGDNITNDSRPTIDGHTEPGADVTVKFPTGETVVVTADANGDWSVTPTKPLPDGAGDITVVATDPAGNPSQPTVISLDIDTTAPDAPKVWLDPASDTGIKGDNITSDTMPTIDGKTEPNADVKVTLPTGEVINVKADDDGNWSVTPTKPLTEGDNSISVTATDAAGNDSQPTVIVVGIDTTTPPKPVIGPDGTLDMVYDNVEPKVGPLNSGDSTNDTRPTFSGNGEPNQTITLYDGGKKIAEAVVGQDGKWSYEAPQDKPLSEGAHDITVTVTDVAGNVSPSSDPFVVVVDTIAPDAPQVWLDPDSDTGVKGDGITNETKPTIDGHTEPHADVKVTLPTGEVLTATADENGNWSVTPSKPLPEGNNNISVTAADAAGNTSPPTVIVVDIDTTPPDITKLLITGVEDHVAPITGNIPNGGETDDARPEISGKGTAGDTVIVFSKDSTGNHEIGRATVGADGTWKLTPTLPLVSGANDLTAVEMDVAGNKTDPSAKYSIDVVIGAPSVPTIISVHDDVGPYQGFLQKGDVTDDSTPTFKGSADGGSVIKLYDGSTLIGSAMVDASGNWSITTDKLADGPHEVIATATNSVGQSSEPTGGWNFSVDTTAPDNVMGLAITDNVGDVTGPLHAGDTTDDNRPVFSGGAEPNGKVIIYDNGKAIGEVDVGADGKWSFTPTAALANGDHAFSTEVLDQAGNSSGQSAPLSVIVDTSKVLVSITHMIDDVGSITGDISNGGYTDDTRPTIQGTGKVGSIITVYDGSTKLGTAGVAADGSWTFKPTASLSEGAHTIKATATDLAGNVSDPATFAFIVDTTAPGKPTIDQVLDDVGAVQGPIANGGVSDDPNPTLSGKAEAGSRVAVYDNGAKLGEVTADKSGQWNYTPTTPITEGKHDFTVTATDAAGNTSANSDVFSITTDYSAPVKPSIDSVYDNVGEIQGIIARGGVTDDSKPVLSGEAEPGSKVIIYDNGLKLGEAVADANGAWSYTPVIALSEGHHDFTVTATDAAGNVSVKSDDYAVDTDYTAPDFTKLSITGVEDHVGPITGNIVNGGETDDARPEISGKGTAGDTVIVFSKDSTGNHEIGRATVGSDGTWKLTPSLPLVSGVNDLTAVEMDVAGNKTAPCDKYSVTLVTVGPTVPTVESVFDDVGPYTGFLQKGDVTDDNQPTFKGAADAGSIVKLYDGNTLIGSAAADSNGKWEITTSVLADGTHNVIATATNSVGLVSSPTGIWNFSVDTTAPANVTGLAVTDNVGAVTGPLHAGDTTDDNRPVFSGGAEPNGKVIIYDNGKAIGEADVGADGKWSFTPTAALSDGNHAFSTEVLDKAGNSSGQSAPLNVVVDTSQVLVAITHVIDDVGSITGDISNGGFTDDTRPEIQGTGKAGSVVTISDGNTVLGSLTVDASEKWSFTPAFDLGQGAHSITAKATDKAGNVSDPTAPFTFTIDTVAPVKPTIDQVLDDVGAIQGPIANHGVTDDPTPTLSGQAEANSKVTIYDNGSVLGSVMADANGAWSYTPTTGISEGDHNFTVDATDKAGNTSVKSDVFNLTTDYTPPDYSKLAITGVLDSVGEVTGNVVNNGSTDDTRPVISGTGTAGDTIFVYDKDSTGNHQVGSAIVDASGHWSLTPTAPLISGVNELTAVERDPAGNTTAPSAKYSVTVVTVGPAVPTIESVFDDVGPYTGFLQKGDVTDDSQPTFKGTSDAGTTVKLYDGSTLIGSAVTDANGSWSIITSALADGLHNVTATATDPIGQVSAPTGIWNFSVDTTAPANVTGLAVTDNVGAVTGPLHAGDTTDDNRPVFSGGAEPNGKVIIYDNGKEIGEADVGADGKWSFTPTAALSDGNHAFSTEVLDKAGNSSGQNSPLNVIVDTSKVLVSITHLIDDVGSITGDISNGGYTDDTRPEIQGTGKAGSVVTISDGNTVLGSLTVDASEKWSFTPAFDLGQGAHSITAKATDKAGNVSDPTAPFTFTIDTVAPFKPTIDQVLDDVGAIQGPIANHGVTDDPTPTLSGQAEANSKVTIYDNGSVLGSVMADANGAWSYTPTTGISEGDHNFTVDATDKAGNTSVKSDVFNLTTDYTPPDYSKLAITGVLDSVGDITGNVSNGGVTDDARPVISGIGTAGDTITVYVKDSTDNHRIGTAIVDATGHWTLQPATALALGLNDLTAVESDPAGNATAPSAKYSITLDTTTPTNLATITGIADDTGFSDHDFITQDRTLLVSGQVNSEVQSGQKVQFSANGGLTWKDATLSDDRLRWTYDNRSVSLADGTYTFEARVVSESGIAGQVTTQQVVIDNSQPTNKVTFALDPASDNGVSNTDNITSIMTPTINGTVKSGSHKLEDLTITLFWDKNGNNQIDEGEDIYGQGIKVKSDGTWSTDLWSLHYGDYLLKAVATTASGVTGSASYVGSLDDQNHILTITQSVPQHYYGAKQAGFEFGWDVVNIGDFNGDGIDDLLVSARNSDTLGRVNNGGAWILFGSENGLPVLDQNTITNLKPSQGIFFAGAYNGDIMGTGINALGDFNGDGYKDVIISSHWPDKIYVIFGGPNNSWGNGTVDLATIDAGDNTHGFVIRNPGVNPNNPSAPGYDSWNGIGVGGGGDFNGDGYTDLLFGNREAGPNNSGAGYVLYGGANVNKNIVMDWSNPATGTGSSQTWAHFPAGVNGTTITNSFTGTVTNSSQVNGVDLGDSINNVGDVNGDGIDDFVIADPRANNVMSQGYGASAGTAYLVYGKAGGLGSSIDLKNMTLDQGIRINSQHYEWLGSARQDYSTNTITALGDINGDGINDFAISAPYSEPGDPGRVWIIYGKAGGYTSDINLDALNTVGVPSQFNTNPMFDSSVGSLILNEKATYNTATGKWTQSTVDEWFGVSIRAGGDINGDGINDFIIGARYADRPGKGSGDNSGAVYVVYGNEHGLPAIWSIKDVINDPTKGYALYGEGAGFELGNGVAMGDWNGDGMMDIATGAYNADFTATDSGAMYVYYSASDSFTKKYTNGDDYIVADGKDDHGNPVNDYIVGGFGNDTIVNIGTLDYANGGEGNDFIHIVSTDFLGVNGGSGTDTLVFDGQGLSINLAVMKNKVISFEKFDLGHGGNSLTVKLDDVLRMGESDLMFKDGKKQLVVNGDASGNVDLVKTGITWTESSATGNDGHAYKVYSSGTGEVWIEDHVQVHLVG